MKSFIIVSCMSLFTSFVATSLCSSPALAQRYRVFENPTINGLWVDACILEYGEANCSSWGKTQAANAFCRQKNIQE